MLDKIFPKKFKLPPTRAQAMVEFAIVLPILLVLIMGIIEVGRMIFVYAATTNASREAARFGSAIGFDDTTYYPKYQYCSGIRTAAKKYGFLLNLQDSNIAIAYDQGPSSSPVTTKCAAGMTNDPTVAITMGKDRIVITVTKSYTPLTKLLPIPSRNFVSTTARTIAGNINVDH